MQDIKKNKRDFRLYDFVKEKIKKYLQAHRYRQGLPQSSVDCDSSKIYFFRQDCDAQSEELIITASAAASPVYEAYMIAMMDALLREMLKIEYCTLTINLVGCGQQCAGSNLCNACAQRLKILEETLMMLSVSYAVDQTLCCLPETPSSGLPVFAQGYDGHGRTDRPLVVSNFAMQNRIEACGQAGRASSRTTLTFSSRLLERDYAFCTGAASGHDFSVRCDFEKLMTLVEKNIQALMLPQEPVLSIVVPTSDAQQQLAVLFTQYLQQKGRCVDVLFPIGLLSDVLQQAENMGAQYVLLIGPEEQKNSTVIIKNVATNQLRAVKQVEAHLVVR